MKVSEMLEILEDADPDDEVFIASIGYRTKFQYQVSEITMVGGEKPGVYLLEGSQIGYLSREARRELGA